MAAEARTPSLTRTRVNITTGPAVYYTPDRDPLLPPISRATELPMSSQSFGTSSPERVNDLIGESLRAESSGSVAMKELDGEDEFDGIEDAPIDPGWRSTSKPSRSNENFKNDENTKVTMPSLDDLFSDDEGLDNIATGSGGSKPHTVIRPQSATRQPLSTISGHGQSSPLPAFSISSHARNIPSDTPPSPLPKTPQTDEMEIIDAWSPSPLSPRTKARRGVLSGATPSPQTKKRRMCIDISDETPPKQTRKSAVKDKGTSTKSEAKSTSKAKGKAKAVEVVMGPEDELHSDDMDLDLFDELDFGLFEQDPASSSSARNSNNDPSSSTRPDPGRAFRPSSSTVATTTHPPSKPSRPPSSYRQVSPPSDILSALDDMDRPDRLRLITELSEPEQDFYKNHWRRGADTGSKKRGQLAEEEEWDDGGEFTGPQPTEKKKVYKKPARGFRGKGRAGGRGRGRAR